MNNSYGIYNISIHYMLKKNLCTRNMVSCFFFFFEIGNDFDCSLLLASDFSIQDKIFGEMW